MDAEFEILGRRLSAHAVPERVGRWLEDFWHYPQHHLASSGYRITASTTDQVPDLTESTWIRRMVRLPDRVVELANRGSRWIGIAGESGMCLTIGETESTIDIWGNDWDSAEDPYHFLYLAFTEALRASGLLPLHAAVASRGTGTTAFLGQSGTGKSTTLLRLVKAGWTPIAEDLCWVEPGSLKIFGWDRGVRLWPASAERFFAADAPVRGRDGKMMIPYDRVGDSNPREGVLERIAVLIRKDSDLPRWDSSTGQEGVRALWEATGLPLSDEARAPASAGVQRIAKKVTFARLILGGLEAPLPQPQDP